MAPKKAPKPNAYMIFAQELMNRHGRKYDSLREACDAAGPLWAKMSPQQRLPYDNKARELKNQLYPTKYTSDGLDVQVLTAQEQKRIQTEESARQQMRTTIQLAQKEKALDKEVFLLIHFNMFCYQSSLDQYYPAEVAIVAFDLKDGVLNENIFHSLINPGPLPIGYKCDAKQHADQTHLLKVPYDDDEECNIKVVYDNLKEFLQIHRKPGAKGMPILYADKKYIKMIQTILDTWSKSYDDATDVFKVYNLQVMFSILRNSVAGEEVWHSLTFSERELEKDVYSYVPEIACPYHLQTPRTIYCSRSIVLRYAFVICDNCCSDLNIDLINGQHVPSNSFITSGGSSASSLSGFSVQSKSRKNLRRHQEASVFESDSNTDTWEVGSVSSNYSASTMMSQTDDEFPELGKSRSKHSSSNDTLSSVKPARWFNAAVSGLDERLNNLSLVSSRNGPSPGLDSSDFPPISIGRGRRTNRPKPQ